MAEDLRWWRHIGWTDEHLPNVCIVGFPEFFRTWEDTIRGICLADVWLVVEKCWVLAIEDLPGQLNTGKGTLELT